MAEPTEGAIDSFLLTAIKIPKDKIFILKLDKELEVFINDESRSKLVFPQMNSYQRRVVHRVADYFNLSHSLDSDKKAIVLRKNERTEIPVLRMSDLIEVEEDNPKISLKIMQRNNSNDGLRNSKNGGKHNSGNDRYKLSLEEREAIYQQARARIFNDNSSTSSTETRASGPSKEKTTASLKTEPVKPKSVDPKTPERAPSSTGSTRRSDNLSSSRTSPVIAAKPFKPGAPEEQLPYVAYKPGPSHPVTAGPDPTFEAVPYAMPPSSESQFTPNAPYYDPYTGQFFPHPPQAQPSPYYPGQFYPSYHPYDPNLDQSDPRIGKPPTSEADAAVAPSLYYSMNPSPYNCQQPVPPNPFPYEAGYRFWGGPEASSPSSGFPSFQTPYPANFVPHYPHPTANYQAPYQQPPFHYRPPEFIRRPPSKNRELFDPNKPNSGSDPRRPTPAGRKAEATLVDQFNRSLNISKPNGSRTPKKQDNLIYDYSGDSYEGVRPTDKPVQPNHILEIYAFASNDSLLDLNIPGATIKRLKSSGRGPTALAVFKNTAGASKYLEKFLAEQSCSQSRFKLRVWVPTLYDPSKSSGISIVSSSVPESPVPEPVVQ
ncbi:hypothetical protein DSO57_1000312 [Entomophthora muscae]|uniref:Uncharacterized protein n=1 Tax=Entomophthora muscae TaxID=34485 RepID=A0ACC2TK48_9FUNG|nr:hypothetical protein DSO57_1000312 [Entomophthora muscae]